MSDAQDLDVVAYVQAQLAKRQTHVDAIRKIDQMCAGVFDLLARDVPAVEGANHAVRPLAVTTPRPTPPASASPAGDEPDPQPTDREYGVAESSIVETMAAVKALIYAGVRAPKALIAQSPYGRHRVQLALRRLKKSGEVTTTGATNALRYWLSRDALNALAARSATSPMAESTPGAAADVAVPLLRSKDAQRSLAPRRPRVALMDDDDREDEPQDRAPRQPVETDDVSPLTHRAGDPVIVDGVEFERVWAPHRDAPSLIGARATRETL